MEPPTSERHRLYYLEFLQELFTAATKSCMMKWASLRTSRSAWPIGLICIRDSSSVQVWLHLVRPLVRQHMCYVVVLITKL